MITAIPGTSKALTFAVEGSIDCSKLKSVLSELVLNHYPFLAAKVRRRNEEFTLERPTKLNKDDQHCYLERATS